MRAPRANNLCFVFCLCASGAVTAGPSRICDLAVKRGGLVQYTVKGSPDQGGNRTIKADIDLDGLDDELRWSDRGPGSGTPADNSTVTLTLTSNRKSFALEQQRMGVVKFESRYYVVTMRLESELGPWYREVFAATQMGLTRICSFEGKGQAP
jgi:hypothetical protein